MSEWFDVTHGPGASAEGRVIGLPQRSSTRACWLDHCLDRCLLLSLGQAEFMLPMNLWLGQFPFDLFQFTVPGFQVP